ncbi:hypothetical protein QYF36_004776 [Acer negundo]|nr:hypothetical protein QYF36_004776 [Acer negundo]
MGNPLLDISAVVDDDFLQKYDIKLNNAILAEDKHLPMSYSKFDQSCPVDASNSWCNKLHWLHWQGQVWLGDEEGFKKCRGQYESTPTGTCAVCVAGGERSLVANLSAANCYKFEHLRKPENWALGASPAFPFLLRRPNSIQLVAEHAAANNKVFTMNLSAPFICEFFKDAQEKVLPYMDYVFGNETEARTFSKVHGWETDDVEEIALKISQWPKASGTYKRITVITQGADPVVVAEDGKVKKFPVILLPKEKLVDTTGEGDAFVGGFMSQLVQGKPIDECVRAGCYVSNFIIQRAGCT